MEAYDWRLGPGEYLLGVAVLVVIIGSALYLGLSLRRKLLPAFGGPVGLLATGTLTLFVLIIAAQLMGIFGLFNFPIYPALLLAAAGLVKYREISSHSSNSDGEEEKPRGNNGRALQTVAFVVAAVVLIRAGLAAAASYGEGMTGFDTHWYHGPITALFLQHGDTFALYNEIAPQYLSWFYPHNSELLHAIAGLPFERDLLSPGLNLIFLAGSMLAAWCIGRPFGVAPLSLIGASLILASGLFSDQAGEMRNDLPAVFFVLAAAALAIEAWTGGTVAAGPGRRTARDAVALDSEGSGTDSNDPVGAGELVAIGIAAGMAAGTKLNYLATAGALVLALAWAMPRGRRLRGFGLLFGAAFLAGGYWYLRNLFHAGNPLPWITSLGPIDLPGPSQEVGGRDPHGVIEYLFDPAVWRDWFLPGLREGLTLAWPLIVVAATLSVILLALGHRGALLFGGFWNPRTGRVLKPRASRRRFVTDGGSQTLLPPPLMQALAVTILATVAAWLIAPASAEGPTGEPVGFVSGLRYLAPALALALALLPVALQPRQLSAPSVAEKSRHSPALVAVGVLALFVIVMGGFVLQRTYLEHRYAEPNFATPGLRQAFAAASKVAPAPEGAPPVAVTATRIYPFYGPDLKQPVTYVGIAEPEGGFRRPETCAEWRSAVDATGAETVIVAWDRLAPGQEPIPPEAGWISSDPAAETISVEGGAAIIALHGALDPDACD